MGKRNSKGGSKKSNSKKHREKNSKSNVAQKEEKNSQQEKYEGLDETTLQDNVEADASDVHTDSIATENSAKNSTETSDTNTTNASDTNDINDYCEEIKAKQEEHLKKLNNLSIALTDITLIRDNVNSIRVDTLTELYFTRQVRPLLDALNIISFSVSNMTTAAVNIQTNTFGDRKEIRHALSLSYKMNDQVEDIIDSLERRLKIFLDQIDKTDKKCPPFDVGKDS